MTKTYPTTTNISDDMIIPIKMKSHVLDVPIVLQTEEHSCATACLEAISQYLKWNLEETNPSDSEENISEFMIRENAVRQQGRPGTHPETVLDWAKSRSLHARIAEESWNNGKGLAWIISCLEQGIPPLICWADWGGHWCVVTGYITGGSGFPRNDTIILMDPADPLGNRVFVNAGKFYLMWYDGQHFDRKYSRPLIAISSQPILDEIFDD